MSVGHVARAVEESGIPTVTIVVRAFEHRVREMKVPRALVVRNPMGRPLGAAGDAERQDEVVNAALDLVGSATENNTIVQFPHPYRPNPINQ